MFAGRFSSSTGLLGIDFGSRSAKLLQVREHQRQLHVVGAAHIETLTEEGEGIDTEELTRRIRAAVTGGGFTGRKCMVSLPRTDVCVQSIRLPRMPDSELRQAASWEASQRFSYDREAMEADFIRTGATLQSGEGREEILLVAAPHAALQPRLMAIMDAGLRPVAVEADFVALARIFSRQCRRESDRSQVRVVVEVGASGSMVMILRGDQIAFAKPIGISGGDFNRAVAEHLQLDEAAAAELRAHRIAAATLDGAEASADPSTDRAVFEAVRPLMGDVAKEVILCLRYYGVTFRGHPPERIIVTGGDGREPKLDQLLEQACKISVSFDDAMSTLEVLIGQIRTKLNRAPGPAPGWAVAAGLSARGLGAAKRDKDEDAPAEARRGAA